MEGIKNDANKLRYDLLPLGALEQVVGVLTHGAHKYGDRNWEKGISYSRIFSATQRHIMAWFNKYEDEDNDSGYHPLAHAICELLFALTYEINRNEYVEFDDRPTI